MVTLMANSKLFKQYVLFEAASLMCNKTDNYRNLMMLSVKEILSTSPALSLKGRCEN